MRQGTDPRVRIRQARRLVVKVGSSSLTTHGRIDPVKLDRVVNAVAARLERGTRIVLVSSGAVAAGLGPLGMTRRPRSLSSLQAAASVGQGQLTAQYAERFGARGTLVGQVLLTVGDLSRIDSYQNASRTLERLLALGALAIVNENDTVATQEIRFGDNDQLAAQVAGLVAADALVLLSDVDALYTAPPSQPGAKRIDRVDDVEALSVVTDGPGSGVGTGGMVTKLHAARIAAEMGIPTLLAASSEAAEALDGAAGGTVFAARASRRPRRLAWLENTPKTSGVIQVDAGAVRALTQARASLLAVGVTAVSGHFHAGDAVTVTGPNGTEVARGIPNYSAAQVEAMKGLSTGELIRRLGADFAREVIHADVIVPPPVA